MQGRGDMNWGGAKATIIIANADYFGLPYSYTKPNTKAGSCSAIVFQNCDIRADQNATSCSRGRSRMSPSSLAT